MVHVEIRRRKDWETLRSVCGYMFLDNIFECYTLEPARVTPVIPGHPCIVAGTYEVIITMSPNLHYDTPEVLNVPGRTNIRWHIANRPEDVEGCAGVGTYHQVDWVGSSGRAFRALMAKLKDQKITVTYIDNWMPENTL